MFDVESNVSRNVPLELLEIVAVSVKGSLGELKVWYTNGSHLNRFEDEQQWHRVFNQTVFNPNQHNSVRLDLTSKIPLPQQGQRIGLYIHTSTRNRSIVYSDERSATTYSDSFLKIFPGIGHTTNVPFSVTGRQGWPWRPHREFIGTVHLEAKFILWRPVAAVFMRFGPLFKRSVFAFLLSIQRISFNTKSYPLNRDVVNSILEFLDWNAFDEEEVKVTNCIEHRDTNEGISWYGGQYWPLVQTHSAEYLRRIRGIAADEGEIGINDFEI